MSPLVKLLFGRIPKGGWEGEEGGGYKVRGKSEGGNESICFSKFVQVLLGRWEDPFLNHRLSYNHARRTIDVQQCDCRSPDGRYSDEDGTVPAKMLVPNVFARVEEVGPLASLWINAADVRPFSPIAFQAAEREI